MAQYIPPLPGVGAGIALAQQIVPSLRTWWLENLDTGEKIRGQFEPSNASRVVAAKWAQNTALNRENAILQFLQGSNDTHQFSGMFFKQSVAHPSPEKALEKLISWARIDPAIRRPPIVRYWLGDGHVSVDAVITGISNIVYGRPDRLGMLRQVSFTVDLLKFQPFSLDDTGATDTRYARAKQGEYYEFLAFQEYGNPMIGDVIRKDHPKQPTLVEGDVVKLPSIEGVRGKTIQQTSVPLKTSFGRRDTPQRRLRLFFFELRSKPRVSHRI